ncbi:MAG: exonuclease SbcCD subunit D [Clostridium sp.]|uniref:exonuclease SbcCD subunit D n=1 Tax=Clostridium sp. TaxID=1506 RepID=UPI002FCBC57E
MKFVHLGDLHIGKIIHEFSMLQDQQHALNSILDLLKEEEVDGLIIAGDLYDRSVPPSDAVEVLSVFLTSVLEMGIKIFAISGNHDSSERISFLSSVLEKQGLYIEGTFNGEVKATTFEKDGEEVNIYLLPYLDPALIRKLYKDSSIKTHEDALRAVVSTINIKSPSILVAHAFVGGSSTVLSDSERPLSIGNAEIVSPEIFKDFDYVALGHLHRSQRVLSENIRYSGSLLKYSTSEANNNKDITIVDINKSGASVYTKKISILRDLRIKRGYIKDLISPENYEGENLEDYVFFELLDAGDIIDPIGTLRGVYKNVLGLRRVNNNQDDNIEGAIVSYREKSINELFDDFYLSINGEYSEDRVEMLHKYINETVEEVIR